MSSVLWLFMEESRGSNTAAYQELMLFRREAHLWPDSGATSQAVPAYSHFFLPQRYRLCCAGQLEGHSKEILQLKNNHISLFMFLAVSVLWSSSRSCVIPSATAAQGQEQLCMCRGDCWRKVTLSLLFSATSSCFSCHIRSVTWITKSPTRWGNF